MKGGVKPSAIPSPIRARVTKVKATSANPYRRGQVLSQFTEVPMASLRSAELIANLSPRGIPLGQNRAPLQVGTHSTARTADSFRKQKGCPRAISQPTCSDCRLGPLLRGEV